MASKDRALPASQDRAAGLTASAADASSRSSIPSARFWTFGQNNSGGFFDHDAEKGIGYAICVEAIDVDHAVGRARKIIDSYPESFSCPCCGERWSLYTWDDEGEATPMKYGEPLRGGWGIPSYIHYYDGRIEAREPEPRP